MNFVTHFNSKYLLQGLAMYDSLVRYLDAFQLWVVCMDEETYEILTNLNLSKLKPVRFEKFENERLCSLKKERSLVEYFWTVTPVVNRIVFELDSSVECLTYLDADMWLLNDPTYIFEEFSQSNKDVLITRHDYAPKYDQSKLSGKYCVQLLIFNRNSLDVLAWWEERCVEWCYGYADSGRFGDQKYLESFESEFPDRVHVLKEKGLMLAPWNASIYTYSNALFYHFHGLKIYGNTKSFVGRYEIPKPVLRYIYMEYLSSVSDIIKNLESCNVKINYQSKPNRVLDLGKRLIEYVYYASQSLNKYWISL